MVALSSFLFTLPFSNYSSIIPLSAVKKNLKILDPCSKIRGLDKIGRRKAGVFLEYLTEILRVIAEARQLS
jgi:hypothetical protein